MRLTKQLRSELKRPLGRLLPDPGTSKEEVLGLLERTGTVITVGDRTTERLLGYGIMPAVQIVDGYERREKRPGPSVPPDTAVSRAKNPQGTISPEADAAVKQAMGSGQPVRIEVDGEEDLLVLPACLYAPLHSAILYGQPGEGLVLVWVTPEIRNKAKSLLSMME